VATEPDKGQKTTGGNQRVERVPCWLRTCFDQFQLTSRSILVVDDVLGNLTLVRLVLSRQGFEVHTAVLPGRQAVTHGCSGCGLRRRTCRRGPLLIACESNFTLSWPRLPSGAHNSSDERRGWPVADAGATAQAGWRWILGRTAGLFLLPQLVAGGPFCLVAGRRLDRNGCSSGRRFPGRPSCLSGPPRRRARAYSWIRETWLIWSECQCYGLSWQLEPRAWCRVPFSSNPVSGRQF